MAKKADDLEAVRAVVEALEPFGEESRKRIVRWAEEKLGIADAPETTTKKPRRKKAVTAASENGTERPAGTQDDI